MSTRQQIFHHPFWQPVAAIGDLPNRAGSPTQSDQLEVGDCCFVRAPSNTLYVCATRTLNAAVWIPQGGGAVTPPVGAKIEMTVAAPFVVPPGPGIVVPFDTIEYAIAGSDVTAPTGNVGTGEITITGNATYEIGGGIFLFVPGAPTPVFTVFLRVNGTPVSAGVGGTPGPVSALAFRFRQLVATDIVDMTVSHDSLNPQTIDGAGLAVTQIF